MKAILWLRTLRLIKPLRTVSKNQNMRMLITALIGSIPMLISVTMLWCMVFVLFGIVAMQLWLGEFHYRCVDPLTGEPEAESERLCGGDRACPSGFDCLKEDPVTGHLFENPNHGVTNFDNFGWTFVAVFQ
eukprot:gene33773-43505_t